MTHVLQRLSALDDTASAALTEWSTRPQRNWVGTHTGDVRAAEALLA
tara:strand:+ start:2937 stop:3077 length:141 start_codon:yes stop_codon:yes gene_type:complete